MNLKENLRYLRKQKGVTQEGLAEQLHVSFQTVSKWENGITMPDIEMLPILADYFEISIDELLGYSFSNREIRKKSMVEKAHSLEKKGYVLEAYRYLESEIKYFKMDVGLQHLMGYLAYQYAKEIEGDEKTAFLNRAVMQADIVMKLDQNNTSRTAQAKMLKCYCMMELGNRTMALEIAGKLPSLFSSREVTLFRCADGEEKRRYAHCLESHLKELQAELAN